MHPNLELFRRDSSDDSPASHREQHSGTGTTRTQGNNHELPVDFVSSSTRWNHDILGDQHRMLSPRTGWEIGSPPALSMPAFSSPPTSSCFSTGHLPGPIMVGDDEGENHSLWLDSTTDFQAPNDDSMWQPSPSPSPDTSSGTSVSSLFAATAATTPKYAPSSVLPPDAPSMRPCDRRTLELVHFFFNNLTPVLLSPFSSADTGNPWRRLVLPLTYGSEPLRSVVCAIASAHLEAIGAVSSRASETYREQAVEGLAAQKGGRLRDVPTSLATTLLLIHHDSMVGRDMTNIFSHIQYAHRLLSVPRDKDGFVIPFLEKVFHLYDASAALAQGSEPITDSCCWNSITSNDSSSPPSSPSSASTSFTTAATTPIDTIFGLTLSLWPTLHRLAALRSLTEELQASIAAQHTLKTAVLRAEHQSSTIAIGTALERWYPLQKAADHHHQYTPLSPTGTFNDEPVSSGMALTAETATAYHHAMSYRESALVYLHRAIRGAPASNPLVQESALASIHHCTAALQQGCARIPLWPLFVAACSLDKGPDRLLATHTFQLMGQTPQAAAGKHLWSVVASVWRKLDMYEEEDEAPDPFTVWRDIGQSMGMMVFLS